MSCLSVGLGKVGLFSIGWISRLMRTIGRLDLEMRDDSHVTMRASVSRRLEVDSGMVRGVVEGLVILNNYGYPCGCVCVCYA